MRSLLQQMGDNPQLVQNLLNAPYTRSMMDAMASDPAMASQLLSTSPILANNPQLQEQMQSMMPQFLQQMQNPETQAMMSNPQALNAIIQIQQGMEQLRSAAPGLVGSLGIPPAPVGVVAPPASAPSATTANPTNTTSTTTNSSPPLAPPLAPPAGNPQLFNEFMSRMMNGMTTNSSSQRPEERYASQLQQLAAMGFVNREANLQGKHFIFFSISICAVT